MKSTSVIIIFVFSFILNTFAHNFGGHYRDIECIFSGYGSDKSFKQLSKEISSGIDCCLPRLFQEKFGKLPPENHRMLGHGWTLNNDIPERILHELDKTYPGKREEIIDLWRNFVKGLESRAQEITGLPPKQAKAFATLIYDIHLLVDLEPDNKLVEYVLTPKEIVNDINKNTEILFKNKPKYASSIKNMLFDTMKEGSNLEQKYMAQKLMDRLYKSQLGSMVDDTWKNTLKFNYSSSCIVNTNKKILERPMFQIEGLVLKEVNPNIIKKSNIKITKAAVLKYSTKGKTFSVLRILVPKSAGAAGPCAGVLTFVFSEGCSYYAYQKGEITEREFEKQTLKNLGEAVIVSVAVAFSSLIPDPTRLTVIAFVSATSVVYELAWDYTQPTIIKPKDFIGAFPDHVFGRNFVTNLKRLNKTNQLFRNANIVTNVNNIIIDDFNKNIVNKNRNIIRD